MRVIVFLAVLIVVGACQSQEKSEDLAPNEFKQAIEQDSEAILIDVRTPGEVAKGMISGAVNIDVKSSDFVQRAARLDKNKTYYVYCLSGGRSAKAADHFKEIGITNVHNLNGGILGWQKAGLPLVGSADITDKISSGQYNELINSNELILVDFYAPWCAPCVRMEPMLNEIQEERSNSIKIIRVNIDENKNLAKSMGIDEIPVFKMYESGEEKWEYKGELEKEQLLKKIGP